MNNFMLNSSFFAIQLGLVLGLSPLINQGMKKMKAVLQGRQGPPWLQGYYDLLKYFHKETVISNQASWLFRGTPYVLLGVIATTSLIVPTFITNSPFQSLGGIILLVYLFALGRFFMTSAAMEPGSGFCGMASSREMMLSSLIEPVLLLSLFVVALLSGTTNLFEMVSHVTASHHIWLSPAYLLAIIALFIVGIAEMGRVPFDNPETHYELTMIHEGLLLEYSGKLLGTVLWASWAKQFLILSLLANLLFPWSSENMLIALCAYLAKILAVCIIVVVIETVVAKMRLFRVKDVLGAAFILALIALISTTQEIGRNFHP